MNKTIKLQLARAAFALGLGVVGTTDARAAIVYTDIADVSVNGGPQNFDLNGDTFGDVQLTHFSIFGSSSLQETGVFGERIVGSGTDASLLAFGAPVGPSEGLTAAGTSNLSLFGGGNWPANTVDGYLGVRFLIGGQDHFGWVRIDTPGGTGLVKDFAYESVANTTILAGATAVAAVPEPSTLSLLALGCAGVAAARRRKNKKTPSVA